MKIPTRNRRADEPPAPTFGSSSLLRRSTRSFAGNVVGAFAFLASTTGVASAQVGTNYCTPAPNSTGMPASMSGAGSAAVAANNLTLTSSGLPQNVSGFFLTSRTQGFVATPGGSQGNLCLGGSIGRYHPPVGQILHSGALGRISMLLDLTQTPTGMAIVTVQAGDTWNFQAWFRDTSPGGGSSSNFSDGLEVLFTGGGGTPIPGMVPIPTGTFLMGSNAPAGAPYYGQPSTQPVHQVTLSYPFWMGRYVVTQADYQALTGANPSLFPGASRPVESVSWVQARAYCTALSAQQAGNLPTGYEYRLPTEAEWEYACRAGTTTEFHYGSALLCNDAWFSYSYHSNSSCGVAATSGTVPVGTYAPNAFGLYDMHGNVWEWCLDSWAPYSSASVTDPFVTGGANRVIRGGSAYSFSPHCRSASRSNLAAGITSSNVGFRVVLAPVLVP